MSAGQHLVEKILADVGTVLIGKAAPIRLALACLLARGHLHIEDLLGMGKTTLAQALAQVLGLSYSRIQFTSDLLPADVLGVSVYDRSNGAFVFHHGPIFRQLVLADEINRASPKTQSALLEAMSEGQVSVDGETRPLPRPFFVIATQNPVTQAGTFPLPESQLDRFLMRIALGYPDPAAERELLTGDDPRSRLDQLSPCVTPPQLAALQTAVAHIKASASLVDYLQRLVQHTRTSGAFVCGVSPRGAMAVLQSARAWAFMDKRGYVIPEDIQAVFAAVVSHRVLAGAGNEQVPTLIRQLLGAVDIL